MAELFEKDVNGDAIRPERYSDYYSANVKLSATIPFTGVPLKTHGTRIFSGSIQVPAGRRVKIEMSATVLHMTGTQAIAACWFMDDEDEARSTKAINHIGAGYMGDLHLVDRSPVMDGEIHTFHVNIGATSGEIVLNGMNPATGPQMYGGTLACTFSLEEW